MENEQEVHVQPEGFTLKEKVQYSLLGLIVVGGAVVIGRNWIRKARANHEEM